MTDKEAQDYDKVNEAVLNQYELNEESDQHQSKKGPKKSYWIWVCKTSDDFPQIDQCSIHG